MKRSHATLPFIIAISVALTSLLFAACGAGGRGDGGGPSGAVAPASPGASSDATAGGLTMSVYLWHDEHLKDAAKLYEEKTGIKVNIENNFFSLIGTPRSTGWIHIRTRTFTLNWL